MQYFYSPSTNGFYADKIHGANMPVDAVAISEALWQACAGQSVRPGTKGLPELVPPQPPGPPRSVTMRQARLALLAAEKLGMVQLAISSLPSPQKEAAQIDWEYAATVDRDSGTTMLLAQALGMKDEELDQLFVLAATL